MRLPINLGLKIYLIIFTIFTASSLLSLSVAEGVTYTYYNILFILHKPSGIWYILAILNALLSCLVIIPLYRRAFKQPSILIKLFQCLFYVRIGTTLLGNNYEAVIIQSAFKGSSILMGLITLGVWIIFLYPSFKEHYIYSFRSK
jgi:hypothetical protein